MKKRLYAKKIGAFSLAVVLSMANTVGNVPVFTQAASKSFEVTKKVTIGNGETYQLTTKGNTKGISFSSSNKKIVTVSKSGKIKGKKTGKATITVKVKKTVKKCTVTVKKAPKAIKIKNGNINLSVKNAAQLSIKFTNGYSNKVTFRSSNKAVATVSSKGIVTGIGKGTTTISATTFNKKKATISCVVTDNKATTGTSTPAASATPSTLPTTSAVVSPTNTPYVSEVQSSTPVETATTAPTKTPDITPSIVPTKTADIPQTSSPVPTEQVTTAPTEEATTVPSEIPSAQPSSGPSITPTASPWEQDIATCSAVISKIENGTIYIDNDTKQLDLTDCIRFYKDKYKITINELLVGDTITITYSGRTQECFPGVLTECEKIEVTKSHSNLISARTIQSVDEMHLYLYDDYLPPLTYEPSETKIFKNGEEISFSDLKAGDTIRLNYTHYGDDDVPGFYELLNTVVVLNDEFPDTRTETGVIDEIIQETHGNGTYYYVNFKNGFYMALCDNQTIIKKKTETEEFATDKSALQIGQTITISYSKWLSYDMVPVWLDCKKIVIDTTVPISTPAPTTEPSISPVPSSMPTATPPIHIMPEKPVIYLYPEKETSVSVDLDFHGSLTYTYPYTKDGHWDVVAKPDGTLINKADNQEYSYLFWEGVTSDFTPDFSKGFCVKGEDTTEFLRNVLSQMGLTPKEYNDFIVYWAPRMQNNPYNLISFQTENYEQSAPLHVNPAPDSMLRVYMAYKPLTTPVSIPEQTFTPFERNGFTVVEWGGCEINGNTKTN